MELNVIFEETNAEFNASLEQEHVFKSVSIEKVEQTAESSISEGVNELTITLSDGTESKFNVRNGAKGDKGDKGDTGNVNINDASISTDEAWSSKNIVDKLCPSFAESGSVVACEPIEGYPLTVTAEEGATTITRCRKNLFDFKSDVCRVNAFADAESYRRYGYELHLPPGRYTIKATPHVGSDVYHYVYGRIRCSDGTYSTQDIYIVAGAPSGIQKTTIDLQQGDTLFVFNVQNAAQSTANEATSNKIFKEKYDIQIEQGNTATAYEPYCGETFAVGEPVTSLSGVNNIYADAGDITVSGKADPTAIINKLTNAIISLGGNV